MATNILNTDSSDVQTVFSFQSVPVRTCTENETIWFVAKDVCAVLGITWSGATMKAIPAQWRNMLNFNMFGKNKRVVCISEPAVYKLAFRSNKPEADAFTNWVASEVLPAIRKTGKFEPSPQQPALPAAPSLPDATTEYRRMREDIDLVVNILNGAICAMQVGGKLISLHDNKEVIDCQAHEMKE